MAKWLLIILIIILSMAGCFIFCHIIDEETIDNTPLNYNNNQPENINVFSVTNINSNNPTMQEGEIFEPIDQFQERITKKPFGIFITPATSPVQPERFSGYHTGVDVEYEDFNDDVEVRSIADGKIVSSQIVDGYGGVLVIQYELNGENILALYGHLDPETMATINADVKKGQKIAILGDGYSDETDGERKHLHFAIIKGITVSYKGYVSHENQLDAWIDPLTYY